MSDNFLSKIGTKLDTTESKLSDLLADSGVAPVPVLPPLVKPEAPITEEAEPVIEQPATQDEDVEPFEPLVRQADMSEDEQSVAQIGLPQFESMGQLEQHQLELRKPAASTSDQIKMAIAGTAAPLVEGVGHITSGVVNFLLEDYTEADSSDSTAVAFAKWTGRAVQGLANLPNMGSEALGEYGHLLGPSANARANAMETERQLTLADAGFQTMGEAYVKGVLNSTSIETIQEGLIALAPSIVAVKAMGVRIPLALATLAGGSQGAKDLVSNKSLEFITEALSSGQLYQQDVEILQQILPLIDDEKGIGAVLALTAGMLKDAGSDLEFNMPPESEMTRARVIGGAGAAIDWGVMGQLAKLNFASMPFSQAVRQGVGPSLLPRTAASLALETGNEALIDALAQAAGKEGNLGERLAQIDPAQNIAAATAGYGGGIGIAAAGTPFSPTSREAIGKAASKTANIAAKATAPVRKKLSDVFSPTDSTRVAIEASQKLSPEAFNREGMTVKGEAVSETYNPFIEARRVLDQATQFAEGVDDPAEATELAQEAFTAAADHINNTQAIAEGISNDKTLKPKEREAILKEVTKTVGDYIYVVQELGKKATDTLLDNDLTLTPKQQQAAKDVVLGSLNAGNQTLEQLQALADTETFRNDPIALEQIQSVMAIAEAGQSLRAKDVDGVSSEYFLGNPDKAGHYGIPEYLQRAEAAKLTRDLKELTALVGRMERWMKSGEKTKVWNPEVIERRKAEREYLALATEQVRAMRDGLVEGEVAAPPRESAQPAAEAQDATAQQGPKPEAVKGPAKSSTRPVADREVSFKEAQERAKAAMDAMADDVSGADRWEAFVRSLEQSLESYGDKSAHGAQSIQRGIERGRAYIAKLRKEEGKPAEQAPTSSVKSSAAPAEQEAAQTPEPKMADAVKVAREAMDASKSEDAAQADIPSLEAQTESSPEGEERRDAPKADALLPTGSVTTIVKVKNENATSGLLNGKGLADIVSGVKAIGNRAKGIFMYAVDVASKVVSTNSGIMKSRKVFTDAAMERVKADFPKASSEELATYRAAIEKLFNTLYRDRNIGLLDREQTKGVTTAFADFQNPLAMLMVLNPETNQLELPATVRASIQISALNWVDSLGRQNAIRDLDSVKDLFGLGEYDTIPMHLFNKYVNIGTRRGVAARNIGADILRSLGLSFDGSKVPAGFRDNMESALGAAAIGYLTEKGLVRPPNESTIPAKEWGQDWFEATGETIDVGNLQSITFVQIPILDGQLTEAVETAVAPFKDFPALSNTLLSNETHRAVPTTEASEYVPSSTRKGSTIAENLRDILRSYQATPNRTNQNLKSILAQDNAQEILETLLGLDTFDPNTVHVLRRRAAISANDNAKREISDMLDAYKANPKLVDSDMFFESEFSFQLRNMMTTSGINPQRYASHRHFVSPAAANITINNEVANNPESVGLILDGIIMELGADESTRDSGRVSAKGQLNSIEIPEALAKKMDNFLSGNVVTADSIQSIISEFLDLPEMVGALSSIGKRAPSGLTALNTALNIHQLQQVRNGKLAEFTGQFETENDGKTNGFFLLLAQMPVLGDMVTWFERTGLYLEGVSSAASFNEYINKDGTLDSYQTLGSDVYNYGLDPVLSDFLTFFEGELVTEDGSVTSTLRNLMKNPFMIFNYGASLGRIKKDARLMMESAVISKAEAIHAAAKAATALPEGKERTDALNEAKRNLNTFNEFLGTNFSARGLLEQGQALKAAINTHIHNSKYGSGEDALSTIGSMFGDAIVASIEDSLGALAPVRDMVNETFYHQWSVFDTAFTAAMDRLEAQGEVTQKDADDMMKALEPLLPHYHGYTGSKGVHSPTRIPIFSVETVVTENSRVQVSFRSPAVLGGTKSLTVQAMRRAIKDGGVSGFSIATHSQDAMIMLKLYEAGHQLQGRHDAQAVGALDRVKAAQAANKATVDIISNYSVLHDFMQSAQESLDYAISRGAEVSSEALLLFTESLKALKPEIEAIQAWRMEMLNGKSVSVDQYPTMGGEGAYSTTLNLKPVQITGFQKVTDAAATALRDVIHNPPAGLLTFLNNRVDDKFRKLARELYTYNKDHGDGKLADTPAGALLDTVRNISTVAGFREAMQVNNEGLYEGVIDLLKELQDVARKTRLEGKPFQTREESRSRSGLLSAINKSLGLSQTQASESNTPNTSEDNRLGSLDTHTEGHERIDPVKLAEDAEVQHVTAGSIKSIFEALLSDDTVSVAPHIRKLYEGLINNLIGPALESVGEIGLQLRKNVEDIGGNFGALTSAGISIVSGMPRTLNAQSTTEVFLHELAHRFSFEALLQDTEARAQLSDLFEQTRKALDYKIFLVKDAEGNTVHLTDRDAEVAHAKRMFDYMFNNPDRITTEDGTVIATGLVEFVAYVLTNPAMMEATKDLRVHDAPSGMPKFVDGMDTDSLLSRVFNWVYRAFANVMDWLAGSPKGKDVHQRVFNLVMDLNGLQQKQVKKHQRYFSRTSSGVGKGIDAVNSTVKNYVESVKNALTHNVAPLPEVEAVRTALRIKLVEVGATMHGVNKQQIDQLIEVVMNSDNPIRDLNALESKYSILQDEGFVKSIRDTVTGKLSRSAPQLQRELNRAIAEVDRNRETTRVATKQSVASGFIKKLTNTEKEAITAPLISADIVTLVDRFGFRKVGALLRDNQTLHNEAARLEKAIKENSPKYFNGIIQQAKGMAEVIITGSGARETQVSNIASIVNGSPWPSLVDFQSSHKNAQQLQADLDAYVSLRALIAVDRSTRALTSKVWDREFEANPRHNGITNVITLHRGMKADALKQIFDNNPNHMVKGWTPQMFDADMEWQQANPERGAELERLGWKKVYDISTKIEGGQLALYARKTNGGSELVKGAFGYEGRRARGTNIAEAYSEALGSYDGIEIGALKERAKEVYSRLALRQMNPNYRLTDRKNPIAIQNVEGEVVTYSHIMSESTKREVLGKRSLIDEVMGDYAARTVGKRSSEAVNRDVINALNEDYVANFENNPNDFMWVTAEEWNSDGTRNKFANQFKMLPYDARQAARELWGNRGIPIRKGFGRVVFGGHKYSLANSDLVTQLSERFPNTPLGGIREIVVNIEKVWQEITRIAKVGMVIKTPVVVLINIVSNLMVLAVHRINPVTAMRDAVVGIRELRKYEELSKRLSVLQLQLRGATTQAEARSLGVHVTRLRSQLDASPIRPMVREGMFQSIIEDVDTSRFGYTDKLTEYLTTKSENFIGKTATDVATWLPNQLMMGSNTAVFKFLNKVTQYSDFVARYSFVKQMSKKNPTMPKQQLYNEAIDNFINYNIPDHVGLQWMNDMGIVMFTKYWLGIQHVIARMFKDRPVEALASAVGQMTMYDISDIYDDSLLNKGVTRAFRAPTDILDSATKMYGLEFWKWASPF